MRFRSFQSRIVVFFLGLLALVQGSTFLAVSVAMTRNVRAQIHDELAVGSKVFLRLVDARTQQLANATRLLSGDFAFKSAVSTADAATVLSVLENHQARVGADLMMLVSLEGRLVADTRRGAADGTPFPFPALIQRAEKSGEASSIVLLEGRPYQAVVVPLLAPLPIAWICVGFVIDDAVAKDLRRLTTLQVSFLHATAGGRFTILASTLPPPMREAQLRALPTGVRTDTSVSLVMGDEEYVSLIAPLAESEDEAIVAVLQRSLEDALLPFRRLQLTLLGLTTGGVLVSLVGAVLIAVIGIGVPIGLWNEDIIGVK